MATGPTSQTESERRFRHPGDPLPLTRVQAPPLSVVAVIREGLPPYEDSDRQYMLTGAGWDRLSPGMVVRLARPGLPLSPGQLIVVTAQSGYVLAKLYREGPIFPMKGDLAVLPEPLQALPALPSHQPFLPRPAAPANPSPLVPTAKAPPPPPLPPGADHQQPIYFLPEATTLTPGALDKLKAWVANWGAGGRWVLALPVGQGTGLTEARLEALRTELERLGVAKVDTGATAQQSATQYPAIFVIHRPAD